jgi:hypothetical protein
MIGVAVGMGGGNHARAEYGDSIPSHGVPY